MLVSSTCLLCVKFERLPVHTHTPQPTMHVFFKLRSNNCPRLTRSPEPNPNLHQASWWPVRGQRYMRTEAKRESLKLHTHPHSEKGGRERGRERWREVSRKAAWAGNVPVLFCANLVNELSFWARCCVSLSPFLYLSLLLPVSTVRANTSGHKYSTFAEGVAVGVQLGVEFGKLPSAQITVH